MEIRNYSIAKALKYPDWLLLVAVVLFVFLLQFKFPFYPLFNEGDQFIAAYNADRMLQGDRIYVDFFQFTFPGAQVLFAMLFSLFGLKLWVVNFVVVLIAVVTFW